MNGDEIKVEICERSKVTKVDYNFKLIVLGNLGIFLLKQLILKRSRKNKANPVF